MNNPTAPFTNDADSRSLTSAANTARTGAGDDTVRALAGADTVDGEDGNDFLDGGTGSDLLIGNAGADLLVGGSGADTLDGGDGDDQLTGGAGDDQLSGGAGLDTAFYEEAAFSAESFVAGVSGWTVDGSAEDAGDGVDALSGVDIVVDSEGARFLLVGATGFASIQDALDVAEAGDTIMVAAGEFGAFTVGAHLTGISIFGLNYANAGTAHAGPASTVTAYGSSVAASGVTIAGLRFDVTGNQAAQSSALRITADDVTVENNVFFRTGMAGSSTWHHAIEVTGAAGAVVTHNLFDQAVPGPFTGSQSLGWRNGVYAQGAATAAITISDNVFQGGGTSALTLNALGAGTVVDDNTVTNYGTFVSIGGTSIADVGTPFTNNDYTGPAAANGGNGTFLNHSTSAGPDVVVSGADLDAAGNTSTINGLSNFTLFTGSENTGSGDTLTGSDDGDVLNSRAGNDLLEGGAGGDTLQGAADNDTLDGGAGNDLIDGGAGIDVVRSAATIDVADLGVNSGAFIITAAADNVDAVVNAEILDDASEDLILLVGNGGFASIQAALDYADAQVLDGVALRIMVAGGTAAGAFTVASTLDAATVTISAIGDVTIEGSFHEANGNFTGTTAEFLRNATSYSLNGVGNGAQINRGNVTLEGLGFDDFNAAINFGGGVIENVVLRDLTLSNNITGIRVGTTGSDIRNLTVDGGTIRDGYHGIAQFRADANGSLFTGLTVQDTVFERLNEKGIYLEGLEGGSFTGLTMEEVGHWGRGPAFGGLGSFGNGIDINLKYGSFDGDITITGFDFTNVGTSSQNGTAAEHFGGAAITFKARDDAGSYSAVPATYTGTVTVSDGSIDGTSTAIRLGEPGKAVGGTVTPTSGTGTVLVVSGVTVTDYVTNDLHGLLDNRTTNGVVNATFTADGDIVTTAGFSFGTITYGVDGGNDNVTGGSGSTVGGKAFAANDSLAGGTGDDTLNGAGGNDQLDGQGGEDALDGGDGIDTAVFAANLGLGDIVDAGKSWAVATGGGETDDLVNVEIVSHAGGRYLLVGNGGYATIQEAINAAIDGDTILIGAGTYNEAVNVNKAVTLVGPNHGRTGAEARLAEAVITQPSQITAASGEVTLLGLEFRYTGATNTLSANGGGMLRLTGDADVTIDGARFIADTPQGNVVGGGRGIMLPTNFLGSAEITGSFFGGPAESAFGGANWNSGIWSDGSASALTITDNSFVYVRTALNLDGYDDATTDVSGNAITNSGSGFSIGLNGDSVTGGIDGNTLTNVGTDFNLRNFTTPVVYDAGTNTGDALTALGGSANDTMTGGDQVDVLVGNNGDDVLSGLAANDGLAGGAGNDVMTGGVGDDTLDGGTGIDTATYGGTITTADITANGTAWTVDGGSEGADSLVGVEIVDGAGGDRILLVGSGGFATIQEAVNAAQDGDTIMVAAGDYSGTVTIDKRLTLLGANADIAGHDGMARGDESALTGTFVIAADGVTINGFKIGGAADAIRSSAGTAAHDDLTIVNNWISGTTDSPIRFGLGFGGGIGSEDWTISGNLIEAINGNARTGMVLFNIDGLTVTDNVINHDVETSTGRRGMNLDGIQGGTITGNTVDLGLRGPITDANAAFAAARYSVQVSMSDRGTSDLIIEDNTFQGAYDGVITLGNGTIDGLTIDGNTITDVWFGVRPQAGTNTPAGTITDLLIRDNEIASTSSGIRFGGNDGTANDAYSGLVVSGNTVTHQGAASLGVNAPGASGTATDGTNTIIGTDADDAFVVSSGNGADTLSGGAGNDTLGGGAGADQLEGGAGADSLNGGAGNDVDTAIYTGATTFLRNFDGSISAVRADGDDVLISIETAVVDGDVVDLTAIPVPVLTVALATDTGADDAADATTDASVSGTARPLTDVKVTWTVGMTSVTTTVTALADGTWSASLPETLPDGAVTVAVSQVDGVGGLADDSVAFLYDTVIDTPTIDLDAGSDTAVDTDDITADATPTFTGTAEAGSTVTLYAGDDAVGSVVADLDGTWSITSESLVDGSYAMTVEAVDDAGNEATSDAIDVVVDTVIAAPTIDLADSADTGDSNTDNLTSDTTPLLKGTAEDGATVEIFQDGVSVGSVTADTNGAWSFTSDALADGAYDFTVTATDAAGNSADSAPLTVTVDSETAVPTIDLADASDSGDKNSDNLTNVTTPLLQGTAEAGATVEIFQDDVLVETVTADLDGLWSFTSDALADGSYVFTVTATDAAGNTADGDPLTVVVDTTPPAPPVLTAAVLTAATGGTLTVSGTAEANTTVAVLVGGVAIGSTESDAGGLWTLAYTGAPLTSGAVTARAVDAAGNASADSAAYALTVGGTGGALAGGSRADSLAGAGGNDTLIGNAGNDTLNGGAGVDTADYSGFAGGGVTVTLATGVAVGDGTDSLVSIEAVIGTGDVDFLFGDDVANLLVGGAGDDILDGGVGDDTLVGGIGADEMAGGTGFDLASYAGAAAGVNVSLETGSGLAGEAAGDTLFDIEALLGSMHADTLTGSAAVNLLDGGAGNDLLTGGAGGDTLIGGLGFDIASYAGSSSVIVNLELNTASGGHATGDVFSGFEGVMGGSGSDNLTGDAGDNLLDGQGGNDVLTGGLGNDTLLGGLGNDQLVGGLGNDSMDGGDGIDTASYSAALAAVQVLLWQTAAQNTGAAGTDTLRNIENAVGSAFNDLLQGNSLANVLTGGDGNDSLSGFEGADLLLGGGGNDALIGGSGADTFNGGEGVDVANFGLATAGIVVNLQLGTGLQGDAEGDVFISIETVLATAFADTLTGDGLANALAGNGGNDSLSAGGGADWLSGGGGADTLTGGAGGDIFFYGALTDSSVAAPDLITDFTVGQDVMNLSTIDANAGVGGDQAFAFIGAAAFTAAGQARAYQSGGDTFVELNVNGDLGADALIRLSGLKTLVDGSFVL